MEKDENYRIDPNLTRISLQLLWIDWKGEDIDYSRYHQNTTISEERRRLRITQQTFTSHPWKFVDSNTNELLAIYIPVSNILGHKICFDEKRHLCVSMMSGKDYE